MPIVAFIVGARYPITSVGSSLRHFAADVCAYKISPERFAKNPKDFPKEVLLDIAIVLSKVVSTFASDDDDDEEESGDWHTDEDEDEEDNNGNQDAGLHEPGIHSLNPH
jgi:hypothetical protein